MTGYASANREGAFGAVTLEVRSVNHRYLDVSFRAPEEFRAFEPAMREQIAAVMTRGKVEVRIGFARAATAPALLQIDEGMLARLAELSAQVKARLPHATDLSVNDVLRWPGMFGAESLPLDALRDAALGMLADALKEFGASRQREGAKLAEAIVERAAKIEALVDAVAPRIPQIVAAWQEKLREKLREVVATMDEERIRQEALLFATRVDVDEELTRLRTHLAELRRIVKKGGSAGKRLDFLMQELNREANTIGSKSSDVEVSNTSMELKVLIEQMREQVQNIE
ncbi:MAG: YicC family protein [Burkholderiales bacterium]|nr:YicC family protein [Burkholderiales bacterium]